jgi:hypothetical protein
MVKRGERIVLFASAIVIYFETRVFDVPSLSGRDFFVIEQLNK